VPRSHEAKSTGARGLVCHTAVYSGDHPRNSLAGIAECIARGVGRIEIDIHSLDGADYAVYHERRLEAETTARGPIGGATPDDVRAARFSAHPDERLPLLSDVVEMSRDRDVELQLDLKDWRLVADERIDVLARIAAPMLDRVIVSTGQDWNLLRLHERHPDVPIGFDPGLYFDHAIEGTEVYLPRNMGAYGYRDDNPLAFGRTEPVVDYLRQRFEMLALQVPAAREYFLSYRLVLQMLADGFDVAAWLHGRGIDANIWTLDYRNDESLGVLERLRAIGIDRITTNTAPAWEAALAAMV
jgi:glycerophosphoryl diester phosphodiesterase